MKFEVKKQPKIIYQAVTYELTITDENGKDYEIRKWEDSNEGGFYLWNEEANTWVEFNPEEDMYEFLNYDVDY